jgi:hypothetical protein
VRLDHLLSKELHRTPGAGCDRRGECPRPRPGDQVEGLTSTGRLPSRVGGVVGKVCGVARENVETPNEAHCWVLRGQLSPVPGESGWLLWPVRFCGGGGVFSLGRSSLVP